MLYFQGNSMSVFVNEEKQLFVVKSEYGTSCFGFLHVFSTALELAIRLGTEQKPLEDDVGTVRQYEQYLSLLEQYAQLGDDKTWYTSDTPADLIDILEHYRKTGDILRVFLGNTDTGADWAEDWAVVGTVSRSTGLMKVPLLCSEAEDFSSSLQVNCIVRLIDVASRREIYKLPNYIEPKLEIGEAKLDSSAYDDEENAYGVWRIESTGEKTIVANFNSYGKAANYVAFLTGHSFDYALFP